MSAAVPVLPERRFDRILRINEQRVIQEYLAIAEGDAVKAAELLEIDFNRLYRRMRKLGMTAEPDPRDAGGPENGADGGAKEPSDDD